MTGIQIDPDVLRQAAQGVDAAAQQFATQLNDLSSTVTSDNRWGGDEPGSVFGIAYTALLNEGFQALQSHLDKLVLGAENLGSWAQQMEQTEELNLRGILGLGL